MALLQKQHIKSLIFSSKGKKIVEGDLGMPNPLVGRYCITFTTAKSVAPQEPVLAGSDIPGVPAILVLHFIFFSGL